MGRYVFKLPDIGEGTAEAELVAWHVAVGDSVEEDQHIADVMTEKATVEIPAPVAGKVVSLTGAPGQMIAVGSELLVRRFRPATIAAVCFTEPEIVTAGLLSATTGVFNVYLLGLLLTVASIIGNTVGYAIGKAAGPRLFTREDSLLFNKKHLYRAREFYDRHGGATVIIARFMPIVRTFVPVVAGMGQMDYRRYTLFNVIGGVAWIWSMLFIGYFLGRYIPGVDQHIELVIVIVVALSLMPGVIGWLRRGRTNT